MSFFSDMEEELNDVVEEVKPIVPSKEVKEEKKTDNESVVSDDDFSSDDLSEEEMNEILGNNEPEDDPKDDPKEEALFEEPKKEEPKSKPVNKPEEKEAPNIVKTVSSVPASGSMETIISPDTVVDGNITTSSSIVVGGEVKGSVKAQDISVKGKIHNGVEGKTIVISGQVQGEIKGEAITIEDSKISGNLVAEKSIVVREQAVVIGDVCSESLTVYGRVKGDLNCKGIVELKTGSVVKGNVTALEVLIDKGANFQGSIIKTGEIDDSLFE